MHLLFGDRVPANREPIAGPQPQAVGGRRAQRFERRKIRVSRQRLELGRFRPDQAGEAQDQ
jgi:hypothetical protein